MDNRGQVPYTQRVERVFERIQSICANNQGEKTDKLREIVSLIRQHEKTSHEQNEERVALFENILDRISMVERRSVEEADSRDKNVLVLQETLEKTDKKCKSIISGHLKSKQETDKKFREKIEGIFNREREILEVVVSANNQNLSKLSSYESALPSLEEQLKYESELREEIESKIYQQFLDQIQELKKLFESERAERIHSHEQTLTVLKTIYTKHCDRIKQEQVARERNETLMLRVVEQLVNQLSTPNPTLI